MRAGLLTLLGVLSARIVDLLQTDRYAVFAEEYHNLLAGSPYSPAFANRRLGPWSFALLESAFGSAELAERLLVWGTGLALPWLGYVLGRRLGWTVERSVGIAFALCASFVLLQDDRWLQAWDFYDLLFFVCLAYAIHRRLEARRVVPLFLVMLLNRETALFVPLWLAVRAHRDGDRPTR